MDQMVGYWAAECTTMTQRQANVYMIQFRLCLLLRAVSTVGSTEGSMWPGIIVYGASYSQKAVLSVELQDDKEAGREFLRSNQKIWDAMSGLLGQIATGVFKQFQNYPLGNRLKRLCHVFAGCVVNYGANDLEQTEVHKDVKEAQYRYSCIFSCGKYTGGSLVLHDLKEGS
jgi:hypothetical protein